MSIQVYENEPFLKVKSGVVLTNSIDVAENFGKQHKHVLEKIREIGQPEIRHTRKKNGRSKIKETTKTPALKNEGGCDEMEKFFKTNFFLSTYLDEQFRKQPKYEMTRDGFSFLVMGFTGQKANLWKIKYINAFNAMEGVLLNQANASWRDLRSSGKETRLLETSTIANFIEYAQAQGSKNARWYFKHITNATYKALFIVKDRFDKPFREMLDGMQLSYLQTAEYVAQNAIKEGMASGLNYTDIFKMAKSKLEAFASTVGITPVVSVSRQLRLIKSS